MKLFYLGILKMFLSIIILLLMDYFLNAFFLRFLLPVFNWFNIQSWIVKLVVFLFLGSIFAYSLEYLIKATVIIGNFIFSKFPNNLFLISFSIVISIVNSAFLIYTLWCNIHDWVHLMPFYLT